MWTLALAAAVAALSITAPHSAAGAANFALVNATGTPIRAVSIRPFRGDEWQSLQLTVGSGNRREVPFTNQDCAFDIKALVGSESVVWSGINLCEAKAIILRRDKSGLAWADYE